MWIDRVERLNVRLGVRRADLHRDIAALSGLATATPTDGDEAGAPYRGVSYVPPAVFMGATSRQTVPAWLAVGIGLAICGVGVHEYISLGAAEEGATTSSIGTGSRS